MEDNVESFMASKYYSVSFKWGRVLIRKEYDSIEDETDFGSLKIDNETLEKDGNIKSRNLDSTVNGEEGNGCKKKREKSTKEKEEFDLPVPREDSKLISFV